MDYILWNTSDTLATCSTQGFLIYCRGFSGLLYHCSLIAYYMIVVKFNASDNFMLEFQDISKFCIAIVT